MNEPGVSAALIGLAGIVMTALLSAYIARRKEGDTLLAGYAVNRDQNFWRLVEELQEENHRLEDRVAHRDRRVTELGTQVEQLQAQVHTLTHENWDLRARMAALERDRQG